MNTHLRMYDSTGAVIAWVAEWAGPFEGGLTLAMKYAWANSLNGAAASKAICGKTLVQNHALRRHGRSFLIPGWSRSALLDQQPSIGALIARRDMNRYAGRWSEQLASDEHFRYCPDCIRLGYQSILFQVDALISCPFHRSKLLSECHSCGASSPRFALKKEVMATPFCCPACGAAYGEKFNPHDWKCTDLHTKVLGPLLPLVRFLLRVKRIKLEWSNWQEWFGPWLGAVEEREKRIATFMVLRRMVPTPGLDESMFAHLTRSISISGGREFVAVVSESTNSGSKHRSHRQIYKSIRRHLFKVLPRHVDRWRLLNPNSDQIELRNDILWLSLKKCPYLQAVWLWRIRYEHAETVVVGHPLQNRELSLRDAARNWPWQGAGDDSVWAHYVLVGFHAAAEIVSEWWERASAHAADCSDQARLMELYVEFANLLSTSRLPVPPRITTVLRTDHSPMGATALFVVGPTSGMERLAMCCKCSASQTAGTVDSESNNKAANVPKCDLWNTEVR